MSEKQASNKYCVVPECRNTSRNAPEKLFISVPFDPVTRKVWQKAMRRNVFVSDKSHVHCCEDHFNIKEDIENYMYIKTMKKGNIKLKPKVVPRFFDCQKNRVTTHKSKLSQFLQKKEQQCLINDLLLPKTSEISIENEDVEQERGMQKPENQKSRDMGVQVLLRAKVRSKGVQCTSEDLQMLNVISHSKKLRKKKFQ